MRVLGGDAGWVAALLVVVVVAGAGADGVVVRFQFRAVVAHGDEGGGADGYRIGAQGEGLGNIRAATDAAGDDELNFAMQVHGLQGFHRQTGRRQGRNADMLDEHLLGGGGSALHTVHHHHIRPRLGRQLGVVERPASADLDIDRHFPVGDFPQFLNLDFEVVGPGPVRVPAGAALVDAFGQIAHLCHPPGDFLPQQHAAATGFGALPHDDFDGIGDPQVIGIHAVARRQVLIYQQG